MGMSIDLKISFLNQLPIVKIWRNKIILMHLQMRFISMNSLFSHDFSWRLQNVTLPRVGMKNFIKMLFLSTLMLFAYTHIFCLYIAFNLHALWHMKKIFKIKRLFFLSFIRGKKIRKIFIVSSFFFWCRICIVRRHTTQSRQDNYRKQNKNHTEKIEKINYNTSRVFHTTSHVSCPFWGRNYLKHAKFHQIWVGYGRWVVLGVF